MGLYLGHGEDEPSQPKQRTVITFVYGLLTNSLISFLCGSVPEFTKLKGTCLHMPFPCFKFPSAAVPDVLSAAAWHWHQPSLGMSCIPSFAFASSSFFLRYVNEVKGLYNFNFIALQRWMRKRMYLLISFSVFPAEYHRYTEKRHVRTIQEVTRILAVLGIVKCSSDYICSE